MKIKNIETGVVKDIDTVYAKRLVERGTYEEYTESEFKQVHKDVLETAVGQPVVKKKR
jgi:hypothetical protein